MLISINVYKLDMIINERDQKINDQNKNLKNKEQLIGRSHMEYLLKKELLHQWK